MLFLLLGTITSIKAQQPSVITDYYTSLELLSKSNPQETFDLVNKIMCCFAGKNRDDPSSGFSGIDVVDNLTTKRTDTVPSNVFAQRLQRAINELKELRLESYKTLEFQYSMQPKITDEGEVKLCQTKVEALYSDGGSAASKRLEYLNIVDDKIVSISLNKMNKDPVGLTFEAARLYTLERYKEAYDIYREILDIEPENINALYRLGIMVSKGKGTKKNFKEAYKLFKKAESLNKDYNKTYIFDFDEIRDKAKAAVYHMEKHSVV